MTRKVDKIPLISSDKKYLRKATETNKEKGLGVPCRFI